MNKLLNDLKVASTMTQTTNGALTYSSTLNKVYDLFAQGASMRNATNEACMNLFADAYLENPELALKCLFYLRDIRNGQGERRFFRFALKWLVLNTKEVEHLIPLIPEFGRWDDLYTLVGTSAEKEMFRFVNQQLLLDLDSKTPSLLAKWLKSENTSSRDSRILGYKTREALGLTPKQYRKMLSGLRNKINIVETLMSQNRWDEIEFDKLPSRAGFIYKNAFARHDVTKARYEKFIKDENTKVNAGTLYPYDVVHEVTKLWGDYDYYWGSPTYKLAMPVTDANRMAVNKYWDNLNDYFKGASLNALAVVDTSGSMTTSFGNKNTIVPMDVAISLGLYCAERAKGPFKNHFISFSSRPKLIETTGVDFCDKVTRIYKQNLCENTNIEATFDLILNTAKENHLTQNDLPENIIVISNFQFDAVRNNYGRNSNIRTLMENIERRWNEAGYKMPNLIYWNANAAYNANIPMQMKDGVTFVSGASPVIFEMILTGKTSIDLMLNKLYSERYTPITSIKALSN